MNHEDPEAQYDIHEKLHKEAGIDYSKEIKRNLAVAQLYEDALKYEKGTFFLQKAHSSLRQVPRLEEAPKTSVL